MEVNYIYIETKSGHTIMCPEELGPYAVDYGNHPDSEECLDIGMVDHPELDILYSITTMDISPLTVNVALMHSEDQR